MSTYKLKMCVCVEILVWSTCCSQHQITQGIWWKVVVGMREEFYLPQTVSFESKTEPKDTNGINVWGRSAFLGHALGYKDPILPQGQDPRPAALLQLATTYRFCFVQFTELPISALAEWVGDFSFVRLFWFFFLTWSLYPTKLAVTSFFANLFSSPRGIVL